MERLININSTKYNIIVHSKKKYIFYTFLEKTKNHTIYIYKGQRTTDNRLRTTVLCLQKSFQ